MAKYILQEKCFLNPGHCINLCIFLCTYPLHCTHLLHVNKSAMVPVQNLRKDVLRTLQR